MNIKVGDIVKLKTYCCGSELKYVSAITPSGVLLLEEYDGTHHYYIGEYVRRYEKDVIKEDNNAC